MHLIPQPRQFSLVPKANLHLNDRCALVVPAAWAQGAIDDLRRWLAWCDQRLAWRPEIVVSSTPRTGDMALSHDASLPSQGYRLRIDASGIALSFADHAGLAYGLHTLRQLLVQHGRVLPGCTIEDHPAFAARGVYHDITRGKVPTLDTLMEEAERYAHYKLNQLHLYVEHTFAFRDHPDVWQGADPLTAEEILILDEHCAKLHIDLVPSLSTFGHVYCLLAAPRKAHLNILDTDASRYGFNWWDRMQHYTLNAADPEARALMRELISEYAGLFRSDFFNICGDEPFDLIADPNGDYGGDQAFLRCGRRASVPESLDDRVALYGDYLCELIDTVGEQGKRTMFWGDILAKHPEILPRLPKNSVALNWSYSPELRNGDCRPFAEANMPFYVCPGVSTWHSFMPKVDWARANIRNFVAEGCTHGAIGVLNTYWGDRGHISPLALSRHGLLLGAQLSWNPEADSDNEFDRSYQALELGDADIALVHLFQAIETANVVTWNDLTFFDCASPWLPEHWCQPIAPAREAHTSRDLPPIPNAFLKKDPIAVADACQQIASQILVFDRLAPRIRGDDPLLVREIRCALRGTWLIHATVLAVLAGLDRYDGAMPETPTAIADGLRDFDRECAAVWHARNKASEYRRIREHLLLLADAIDRLHTHSYRIEESS